MLLRVLNRLLFGCCIDPFVGGSLIAGGLGFLGDLIGGNSAAQAQSQANSANLGIATQNLQFQERMSNTAYQRSMEDMRRAGLNPILAAKNGGASTPPGASAVMNPSDSGRGLSQGLKGISSSALQAMSLNAELKNKDANTKLATAAAATELEKAKSTANSAIESQARTKMLQATLPGEAAKSVYEKAKSEMDMKRVEYDRLIKDVSGAMGIGSSALDMVNPLKHLFKGKQKDAFDRLRDHWKGKMP